MTPDETEAESWTVLLGKIEERAASLGGALRYETITIATVTGEECAAAAGRSSNNEMKKRLTGKEMYDLVQFYGLGEMGDPKAIACARRVQLIDYLSDSTDLNNVGYVLLASGDAPNARKLFEKALEKSAVSQRPLPLYNRGIAQAMDGNLKAAMNDLKEVAGLSVTDLDESGYVSLLVLVVEGDSIKLTETRDDPNLQTIVASAISALENLAPAPEETDV